MCRAFEQTREEGRLEGREVERLENLRSIIAVSKVSEKEAMDLLRIPTAERER